MGSRKAHDRSWVRQGLREIQRGNEDGLEDIEIHSKVHEECRKRLQRTNEDLRREHDRDIKRTGETE